MLKFKTESLDLGNVQNAPKMPFQYEGVSHFTKEVLVQVKGTCGCTVVDTKFNLQPNESFKIDGALTKRDNLGQYTKSINVTVFDAQDNTEVGKHRLTFTLKLIE
jgi:Protein of unknown function (DUF1573)